MYLYGASGHARVVIDILEASHEPISGLYDDNASISELRGYPVFRPREVQGPIIISIGNNEMRRKIADGLNAPFGVAIHPSAIRSRSSILGEGTVVMQGAIIQSDVLIGRHCIINTGATIDHECVIADFVHISPNATLCGNVHIGEGTQIGAGSVVVPGVKIGKWSLIYAGSVVTRDLPDYCIAAGNRCKVMKIKTNSTQSVRGGEFNPLKSR
mgnify:CR=1 FL=1